MGDPQCLRANATARTLRAPPVMGEVKLHAQNPEWPSKCHGVLSWCAGPAGRWIESHFGLSERQPDEERRAVRITEIQERVFL